LVALRELRQGLSDAVAGHRGDVVKSMGDGWLVEFASVVDAVNCALQVQEGLVGHDIIKLRIGIHIGDIVHEDEDIYGDGVNIAARLQELSEPGGVALSGRALDFLDGKLANGFRDAGEKQLKNIAGAVRVFVSGGGAGEGETLPLPDKPSIAVLPFDNMSGDAEQEFFSDGVTEDIITALSKIRWLFVIARNSTFSYKGTSPDVRRVAGELGVRYVLEGSVRKGGERVRITAQLVDATTGNHVWAERFDRDLSDIFALQDEITETLIAAIEPELAKAEQQRAIEKTPENLDAWSWFHRGLWHHYKGTKDDNALARVQIRKAIELDPEFSRALAALAHVYYWDVLFGYTANPNEVLNEGLSLSRRAITADDKEPFAHFALGRISTLLGDVNTAVAELELSIELSPSFAHAHYGLGNALNFNGQQEQAIQHIDQAIRLNPHDPAIWTFISGRSLAQLLSEQYEGALAWALKGVRQANVGWLSYAILACIYGRLGRIVDARRAVADTLQLKPDLVISFVEATFPFQNKGQRELFLDGLRKAGLPEE
ncbi:MAG: hypothetical protein HN478_08610, partial [Rhodospirillaceae bacterium]|nr:hypothetical protein [Rhodospirillaceae bacterium]